MGEMKRGLTDDHNGEMETLLDGLSVDLVGQICKPNEARRVWVRLRGIRGRKGRCSRMEFSADGRGEARSAWSDLLLTVFRHGCCYCCCCRRRGRR